VVQPVSLSPGELCDKALIASGLQVCTGGSACHDANRDGSGSCSKPNGGSCNVSTPNHWDCVSRYCNQTTNKCQDAPTTVTQYLCVGLQTPDSVLCAGTDQGLSGYTPRELVESCPTDTSAKCKYVCDASKGYKFDGGNCIKPTTTLDTSHNSYRKLFDGESSRIEINNKVFEVEAIVYASNRVRFTINGVRTSDLGKGDTERLRSDSKTYLHIYDIVYTSKAEEVSYVEFSLTQDETETTADCSSGCKLSGDDKCYPFGERRSGKYCSSLSSEFANQKTGDAVCENNYECSSNLCVSGKCIDQGFWEKVVAFFKEMFK
jgi:hypothetical protein